VEKENLSELQLAQIIDLKSRFDLARKGRDLTEISAVFQEAEEDGVFLDFINVLTKDLFDSEPLKL